MSAKETIDFECPKCHAKSQMTIYKSINVTTDPELRQELLEGRLNFFACSKCDQKGYLLISMLYHDMDRGFLVQFHPFPAVRSEEFLRQFDTSGRVKLDPSKLAEKINRKLSYFAEMHVVFDMAELIRYVVFREKLHDLKQTKK